MVSRRRIDVVGTVQGIGFRPYVYRLAREQGLTGSVRNEAGGVGIELQGEAPDLDEFERRLLADLPPSGSIERTRVAPTAVVESERGFVIDPSAGSGAGSVSLAPDHSVCADCLRELADPRDRRYRYPFINCTRCGPRLTITRRLPYDRANTTMDRFALCEACQQEYSDPADRRYHAEPLACPACGPRAWLVEPGGDPAVPGTAMEDPAAAVVDAAERLSQGQVVAIKGIGGFHLAANGRDPGAVARLRQMKRRSRKPLALMVRELKTAQSIARLDAGDEQLLAAAAAPILLARRRSDADVAAEVAPGVDDLGLMLPYSPLHRLLLDSGPAVLVMTSGNEPGEPITADNRQALERLKADAFLLHDREIRVTNDDSVIRSTARGPVFLRRARGYVPLPIATPQLPDRRVLALGASLKVTVATLSRAELVVGPHLGDLDHARAADAFGAEVRRMLAFARVEPEAVAVDLHPDLVSVVYAEEQLAPLRIVRVQHHHAHLAAVLVEHGVAPGGETAGIVLDGFGHGADGAIWGGEVVCGGYRGVERTAHLRYVAQPGGDRGAIEPARMATSLLVDAGLGAAAWHGFDPQVAAICGAEPVSPRTSSAGRLFDGAAAILGLAPARQEFEGEAAIRLEDAVEPACDDAYPLPLAGDELDTRELTRALVEDRAPVGLRAARFVNGLADGLVRAALSMSTGSPVVALGGGCMVNRRLVQRIAIGLERAGVQVLLPRRLPPGDGGISAGQAAIAACQLEEGC
jgi:hydrogenase maturation protein HypF